MNGAPELPDSERAAALKLIGRIYDAALKPEAWPGVVSDLIAFVGGSTGVLYTPFAMSDSGGFTFTQGIPETFVRQRAALYAKHDLWTEAAVAKKLFFEGNVMLDEDLVPEDLLLQSVFYREFLKPQGIGRLCVGIVFGQETPGAIPTICSAMRDISEPRFGRRERERLQVMVPHLSRALGVQYRLRDAEWRSAATLAAIDRLASGIVLLDSVGRIAHANHAAKRLLDGRDGLKIAGLRHDDRRLAAASGTAQASVEAAVRECLTPAAINVPHFSRGVRVPRPSGMQDYVLQFAPLHGAGAMQTVWGHARAIVFLTDPAAPLPLDPALLKRLYALAPAEIRLAIAIGSGATVASAAEELGISGETARSQLKSIFAKTDTHRQSDLMRLLVSLGSTARIG